MATSASNLSARTGILREGMDDASISVRRVPAQADFGSERSIGCYVLNPTVEITPAESVKRLGTGCHRWFTESVHVPIGSKIEFRFQGPMHLLASYNEGSRRSGETSIDGLASSNIRSFVHKLTFVPAGHAYRESHEAAASTRVTFLYLDPAELQKSKYDACAWAPQMYFEDIMVWQTAAKLKKAIESGQSKCTAYLEALSQVLAHELSREGDDIEHEPVVNRGGLASWQKRVVIGYIEEHLGEEVCLPTLAELARLSQHHFCRAFKKSFGIAPHQYHVQRRVEVAKLLLVDGTTSVTDVALTLGYGQTSSFSSMFRKTTGWSPTEYRKEFR